VPQPTVLLYGEDAGDSYYFWQWLDETPSTPGTIVVPQARLAAALEMLDLSLPGAHPDVSDEEFVAPLSSGAFGTPQKEALLAHELGELLIDRRLARELRDRYNELGQPILIRVVPSPSCTRVPWELLDYNGSGERLVTIADIAMDPPIGFYGTRDRQPETWTKGETVYIIDPRRTGLLPVLDERGADVATKLLVNAVAENPVVKDLVSRDDLSTLLRAMPGPARLLYFGHVASVSGRLGPDAQTEAGETAVVLSDDPAVYGVTNVVREAGSLRFSRPLSALDLIYGTTNPVARAAEIATSDSFPWGAKVKYPADDVGIPGWKLWPMPPRVAIVGCESGGDLAHIEPFGLVLACLNNGAELVTATRWTVPTDRLFRETDDSRDDDPQPLIELVQVVDRAHNDAGPIAAIAGWQREQLKKWLASEGFASQKRLNPASPLLWASLATTVAPRKEPRPLTDEEHKLLGDRVNLPAQTA
jgi:hypothetical protein